MTNDSEFNFTATASIWISELRGVFELFTKMSADAGATNVANGGTPQPRPQNKRLQQTQAQVDEVVDIMRVNMEKVLERDAKLSQLDDRADALQAGASQFEASAGKLKNKYWWKNMKMNIIIGAVVLVLIIALGCKYLLVICKFLLLHASSVVVVFHILCMVHILRCDRSNRHLLKCVYVNYNSTLNEVLALNK
ncbi:unnamed protein product [Schistosoma bovis]|nr:unnamed protein product [Schistosoma bovis]